MDFSIIIDFDGNEKDPARIFSSIAGLINSFESMNKELIKPLSSELEPSIILEDFEKGSLKVLFKEFIEAADDESLQSGDYKKVIGCYLVKAKYLYLNWMDKNKTITDIKPLQNLQEDLFIAAKETKLHTIPHYKPVPIPQLIDSLDNIQNALKPLKNNDKALFNYPIKEKAEIKSITFNRNFSFDRTKIEEILTKEEITNTSETIVKIKKPDYLGDSMWDFLFLDKIIHAKITDETWLKKFQNGDVVLTPGDCLRVKMDITAKYDFNNDMIGQPKYCIHKVLKELKKENGEQLKFIN